MNSPAYLDPVELLHKIWQANSAVTLIFLALGMGVWLIGGNLLVASHYRHIGKPAWSGLKPFAFPFKDFNRREWSMLAVLFIASMTLFGFAIGWQ
jgi:hypothetical protein